MQLRQLLKTSTLVQNEPCLASAHVALVHRCTSVSNHRQMSGNSLSRKGGVEVRKS